MSNEEIIRVSTSLHEVLDDIGVDDETVNRKRQHCLYIEALYYLGYSTSARFTFPIYIFGSQSEGTTTTYLNSDYDMIMALKEWTVIQDIKFWRKGRHWQFLMIQDGTVTPGYCLLQLLQAGSPRPNQSIKDDKDFFQTETGNFVLKNTFPFDVFVKNGPAIKSFEIAGSPDMDPVISIPCPQWPKGARIPINDKYPEKWPTKKMKEQAESTGCFVVPVGSKKSIYEQSRKEENKSKMKNETNELEWRISTSKAERILMFSLNTTQTKCYVLLKMVQKTFFYHVCGKLVTSYMCKNIVFHMIAKTDSEFWTNHNLLRCLICCLEELKRCIAQEKCDHFIMPDYNLMWRKFSEDDKVKLIEILNRLLQTNIHIPLSISTDYVGIKLYMKLKEKHPDVHVPKLVSDDELKHARNYTKQSIIWLNNFSLNLQATTSLGQLIFYIYNDIYLNIQNKPDMLHEVLEIIQNVKHENDIDNERLNVASQDVESMIKSLIGCFNISNEYSNDNYQSSKIPNKQKSESDGKLLEDRNTEGKISNSALQWFPEVVHQDNLMASLKKATVLYRLGKLNEAEEVLGEIEKHLDTNEIMTICLCTEEHTRLFARLIKEHFLSYTSRLVPSLCITFLQCEIHCLPKELQYEFFKFPWQQLNENIFVDKLCTYWATIDITVYLYFLQFKTYQFLKYENKKQTALNNIWKTISDFTNGNCHSEVALNILGQCYEQENRLQEALNCYIESHLMQPAHNTATIHICKLLCTEIYTKNVHLSHSHKD